MAGRGNWSTWYEFLFSCIGCLVGLGNIWRFPYLCYKNGGGAFLIPYFIFMFICAFPTFLLEMAYAQFSNLSPGKAWICVPLLRGVGYGMVTMTAIVAVYYNVIMAWTLYYFVMSFSYKLPWSSCNNDWNTNNCYLRLSRDNSSTSSFTYTALKTTESTITSLVDSNMVKRNLSENFNGTRKTPTEEFWERNVLDLTSGVEDQGYLRWQLVLCLVGAWFIVFLCLVKGIKSSGKVMYVASTMPYLLLLVLLVRGTMLDGAMDGFKYYAFPKWSKLGEFGVWADAAVQMFYSAGMGWGGISTLASYNNFHSDVERYAIVLPIIDCLTSFFSGCVIFVNLGYMAKASGVDIATVVSEGPGIAFMVYPEAISHLPVPQLWSVLFFLMLFTVGLDSQIVHVQTLTSAIIDTYPKHLLKRKLVVTALICTIFCLLGFTCVTQGGVYVLQIMDWYCASIAVMFLAFMEMFGLAWIYGTDKLYSDIKMMIGRPLNPLWRYFWRYITPIIILTIWMTNMSQLTPVRYGTITYPMWALAIGWIIAFVALIPLPVLAIREINKAKGPSFIQKLKSSTRPSPRWRAADDKAFTSLSCEEQTPPQHGYTYEAK